MASAMLEDFTRTEIKASGARIFTAYGGKGPPLLLMHGNPFTHLSWHKVAPRLAREFTVVCTDLRGYGDSEKPPGGADHSGYSFRTMAQDQIMEIWPLYASDIRGGKALPCGHYLSEEAPDQTYEELQAFFAAGELR